MKLDGEALENDILSTELCNTETEFLLKLRVPTERGKLRRLKGHEGVIIGINKIIDELRDSVCGIFVIDRLQRSVMRRIFYARKRVWGFPPTF